jgi:hypothetical protein
MLAASLTAGKLALSFIPNVEVVTLFIVLYAVVFGLNTAYSAALIFCIIEGFLYGFNYFIVLYFLYWPLLAVLAFLLSKKTQKALFFVLYAAGMTIFFGVLSVILDMLFLARSLNPSFFAARYMSGLIFFVVHTVSNTVLFAAAFAPLRAVLNRLKKSYFVIGLV